MSKPVVVVEWLDSGLNISDGWQKTDDVLGQARIERMNVTTVGMLMHEDDDLVIVGLSYDAEHDQWFSAQAIAQQNIKSMRVL